ncbi:hypothetical protein [Demetria terragena]|uniref:hypothetical protein n=1 Tax=Demetria terragena TaxID=63959 RepID=UPI0003764F67|nr:hypothetical protein [Demetria terragena]
MAAIDPVTQVWAGHSLPVPIRVLAPATSTEFADFAGTADPQVPAITRSDRTVVIHPGLWSRTTEAGRRTVMRHELTHVALDQGTWRRVPRWVVEGSAEYTAYRRTDLTPAQIAPGLAARVRAGERLTAPPTDTEVSGDDGYGLAWAWCSYLVDQHGRDRFVAFVGEVGKQRSSAGTSAAFRATYGTTPERAADGYPRWLASWLSATSP